MNKFPSNIKFKHKWRNYQKSAIDELKKHLDDNKLNIIAPPGSGKTILGLQIMLMLNKPTLILAPTIAIKNQWLARFKYMFLESYEGIENWISLDIKSPKFLTISTYQGLHSACNNLKWKDKDEAEDEISDIEIIEKTSNQFSNILKLFKKINTKTIVLDESHHLKNEWWKTLRRFINEIKPNIVGLTATPPYDSSPLEWQRYTDLCGDVDIEISVPELIKEGDLCPHQDLVFLSLPSEDELKTIKSEKLELEKIFDELCRNENIITFLLNHKYWHFPNYYFSELSNNLEFYVSILVYLNYNNIKPHKVHNKILNEYKYYLPSLDKYWLSILLNHMFYEKDCCFKNLIELNKIESKLKHFGIIENRTFNFTNNSKIEKILSLNNSKLISIHKIVEQEVETLGKALKMVVLCDYIRKEFLTDDKINTHEIDKIGVIPIFELLRRNSNLKYSIGVLTGSIVILPEISLTFALDELKLRGINSFIVKKLNFDSNYSQILINDNNKHHLTEIVTKIFENGFINVLIGTKALLGEGWDSPSINSLIMASQVGSFVSSNQMRGRAIRTTPTNPNKISCIWHLACVDYTEENGGIDILNIEKRFKCFVGIKFDNNLGIQNGSQRLKMPLQGVINEKIINEYNQKSFSISNNRDSINQTWQKSINLGVEIVEELHLKYNKSNSEQVERVQFVSLMKNVTGFIVTTVLGFLETTFQVLLKSLKSIHSLANLGQVFLILLGIGILTFGRRMFQSLKLYIFIKNNKKIISNCAYVVLDNLHHFNYLSNERNTYSIEIVKEVDGNYICNLIGGTKLEKSMFANTLNEVFFPIYNSRYLIKRLNENKLSFSQQTYFNVPLIFSKNKKQAQIFKNLWEKYIENCKLIYTRDEIGRKELLKARINTSVDLLLHIERHLNWKK